MPVYNTCDFLGEAIQSVLSQTHSAFELILVDDGSTDGSHEIAVDFARKDDRIRLISSDHQGASVARNRGNQIAKGSWLVVMDSDDMLLPEHLEKQLEFISKHPDASVVACLPYYINASGHILGRQFSNFRAHQDIEADMAKQNPIMVPHPGCFMRRDIVLALGGYRKQFWPGEDLDLINRIAQSGYVILVNHQALFRYRIHSRSVSVRDSRRAQSTYRWIAACMRARATNQTEPDWDAFCKSEEAIPPLQRWNQWRVDVGASCYKSGVAAYSNGDYLRLLPAMSAAIALKPLSVPQLIWKRWVQPQLEKLGIVSREGDAGAEN